MRLRLIWTGLIAACLCGPALAQKLGKAELAAVSATPEQIAALVDVKNDSLDTSIRISTQPFYQEKGVRADKFLRASIDKKTGETSIEVYIWTEYRGEPMYFDRVNYEAPDGPISVEATRISHDVLACSRYGCTHREDIGFGVPEATLRQVTSGARAGVDESWWFKVFGRYEEGVRAGVLKTEVAGLLMAIDRERAALGR